MIKFKIYSLYWRNQSPNKPCKQRSYKMDGHVSGPDLSWLALGLTCLRAGHVSGPDLSQGSRSELFCGLKCLTVGLVSRPEVSWISSLQLTWYLVETLTTNEATSLVREVCQRSWCELPGGFLCHNCLQQQLSEFSLSLSTEAFRYLLWKFIFQKIVYENKKKTALLEWRNSILKYERNIL